MFIRYINHHEVVNYEMSGGKEMNTWIDENGKCHFADNLRNWGECLLRPVFKLILLILLSDWLKFFKSKFD